MSHAADSKRSHLTATLGQLGLSALSPAGGTEAQQRKVLVPVIADPGRVCRTSLLPDRAICPRSIDPCVHLVRGWDTSIRMVGMDEVGERAEEFCRSAPGPSSPPELLALCKRRGPTRAVSVYWSILDSNKTPTVFFSLDITDNIIYGSRIPERDITTPCKRHAHARQTPARRQPRPVATSAS